MFEDAIVNEEMSSMDLDEFITKNIICKNNMPSSNSHESNEHSNDSAKDRDTLKSLENAVSANLENTHVDKTKHNEDVQYDSDKDNPVSTKTSSKDCYKEIVKNNTDLAEKTESSTKLLDNIDVISISSDSSLINEVSREISVSPESNENEVNYDSDCSGYHSSDFEFINESEAKIDGLINNKAKHSETTTNFNKLTTGTSSTLTTQNSVSNITKYSKTVKGTDLVQPGPSCSVDHANNQRGSLSSSSNSKYHHTPRYDPYGQGPSSRNIFQNNLSVHNAIPEGERYYDLFRGIYDSALSLYDIHMRENKDFRTAGMNVEFEGIGFDVRLMGNMDGSSQEEFESEAEENARKILQMYPGDNRKRRRR